MCPYWCGRWGGVQPHFCPWKNVCFPIFSHGEKWEKKVYGKKGKSIHFPLFPYTFFPMGKNGKKSIWKEMEKYSFPSLSIYFFSHFSPWEKMGKHTFFHGQNGVGPPPPVGT